MISASYTDASGLATPSSPLERGILPALGTVAPRVGQSLLGLSSGVARAPDQPGYTPDCDMFAAGPTVPPAGYPKAPPSCTGFNFWGLIPPSTWDAMALSLEIRVPTNANSFSFQTDFYTYEYPDFICDMYNDFFVVMMEPELPDLPDGNIAFDQDGNPISVNNSFLRVCEPGTHNGRTFTCQLGVTDLNATGFDGAALCGGQYAHGATGWLETTVPAPAGEVIKLTFAIWDTGDPTLDSTALIDNFRWSVEQGVKPETVPVLE